MTEQERGRCGTGAVAVILSHLRPQNIPRIVEQLDLASQVARIVVSNNNPDIDLTPLLAAGPKLTLIQQPRRFSPSKRFEIAVQDSADFFICIDDDLFLSHLQIDQLLHALVRDPRIPHGIWGEQLDWLPGQLRFRSGIHGIDAPVDILNRCYGFTKEHATRFIRLAGLLGRSPGSVEFGPGEDILLSFTGNALPRCHDLGAFEDCPTSNDPSIAVCGGSRISTLGAGNCCSSCSACPRIARSGGRSACRLCIEFPEYLAGESAIRERTALIHQAGSAHARRGAKRVSASWAPWWPRPIYSDDNAAGKCLVRNISVGRESFSDNASPRNWRPTAASGTGN